MTNAAPTHAHSHGHGGHDHSGHDHSGHDHGGGAHDHTAGASARSLLMALCLSGVVLLAELIGAWAYNSLALLSDAAHMMTDVAALAIALFAVRIGDRAADDRRTFGYKRLEILAAAFNALLLLAASLFVLGEAIGRFRTPEPVHADGMIAVAIIALVMNLLSMRVLMAGRGESLALKGAYLEVWADAIGAVGVIVAALLIRFTGRLWIDPVVAIAIALWILPRAWSLLRDTVNVLLEGVPRGLDLAQVRDALAAQPGVVGVHDLHVWSMSTRQVNGSVHVAVAPETDGDAVLRSVSALLAERFGVGHATIQIERGACAAPEHAHP